MRVGAERNHVCERGHILAWKASPHRFPDNQPGLFNATAGWVAARDHIKLALSRASIHVVHEKNKRRASDEQQARENDGGDAWTRVFQVALLGNKNHGNVLTDGLAYERDARSFSRRSNRVLEILFNLEQSSAQRHSPW